MPGDSSPTMQGLKVRTVLLPMPQPHQTASGVITASPLVFTYTPAALKPTATLIQNLDPLVQGEALAHARNISVSNHLWPDISAQLLCCTPTGHW